MTGTEGRMGTPNRIQSHMPTPLLGRNWPLQRPLLILHGTSDVNVPFLQSVWARG